MSDEKPSVRESIHDAIMEEWDKAHPGADEPWRRDLMVEYLENKGDAKFSDLDRAHELTEEFARDAADAYWADRGWRPRKRI